MSGSVDSLVSFRSDRSRSWCGTSPSKDTRTSEGGWATSCSNSFQLTWLPVAIRPARFYGHFSPGDKIKEIARKCLLCVEPKRVARRVPHAPLRRTVRKLLSTCLRTCLFRVFAYRRRTRPWDASLLTYAALRCLFLAHSASQNVRGVFVRFCFSRVARYCALIYPSIIVVILC